MCDTDNTGSVKIIEKNGGKPVERAISDKTGKQISRYWIDLWINSSEMEFIVCSAKAEDAESIGN